MNGFLAELELAAKTVVAIGGSPQVSELVCRAAEAGAQIRWFSTTAAVQPNPPIPLIGDRDFVEADLADCWLVIVGSHDPAVNDRALRAARDRRIFCLQPSNSPGASGDRSASSNGPGSVALVGGGPGAPDLITVRGRQLLDAADVVLVDRLAPRQLLTELPERVEIIDCGKAPHGHNMSQDEINRTLIEHARHGRRVVRLKGGDPFVFGRGGEEFLACRAAGVAVEVVPGISSALAAAALAQIPVTHRGTAAEFTVIAGHLDPSRVNSEVDWERFGPGTSTLVILMGMERLGTICRALIRGGRRPDLPAAVVHRASLPGQRVLRAPLADLAEAARTAKLGPPSVIVVGDVVAVLDAGELASLVAASPPSAQELEPSTHQVAPLP